MINDILNTTRYGRNGRELTLTITDRGFTMSGGEYGEHALAIAHTSDERLRTHWDGYCRENGWRPAPTFYEKEISGERLCFIAVGSPQSWRNRK